MNPMKRKKLHRLKLKNNNIEVKEVKKEVLVKEEKIVQKEEIQPVLQEQSEAASTMLDFGLSLKETAEITDVVETKKEKKKKWSSQDS